MFEIKMRERKLALVLLDIIGSTRFVQRNGAVHAAKHFQYHDRLTRSLIYKFDGREIDRSDGFLCSFERPIDAVNFALKYQSTLPRRTRLQCRIGIHWGTIIEVEQEDLFVAANAKKIELEGLSKNIAARTMSLCRAGQVLLTQEAMTAIKGRLNLQTPSDVRYVCVGLYKFKGVKEPQAIYAVGTSIESLQPPPGNDKVKRLGGPNKVRSRVRDMKLKELFWWSMGVLAWVEIIIALAYFYFFVSSPLRRELWGLQMFDWVDVINRFFSGV